MPIDILEELKALEKDPGNPVFEDVLEALGSKEENSSRMRQLEREKRRCLEDWERDKNTLTALDYERLSKRIDISTNKILYFKNIIGDLENAGLASLKKFRSKLKKEKEQLASELRGADLNSTDASKIRLKNLVDAWFVKVSKIITDKELKKKEDAKQREEIELKKENDMKDVIDAGVARLIQSVNEKERLSKIKAVLREEHLDVQKSIVSKYHRPENERAAVRKFQLQFIRDMAHGIQKWDLQSAGDNRDPELLRALALLGTCETVSKQIGWWERSRLREALKIEITGLEDFIKSNFPEYKNETLEKLKEEGLSLFNKVPFERTPATWRGTQLSEYNDYLKKTDIIQRNPNAGLSQ